MARLVLITAALAMLVASAPAPHPVQFGYAEVREQGPGCLTVPKAILRPGDYLELVVWRDEPMLLRARVAMISERPCFDRGPDFEGTSYDILVEDPTPGPRELALAVTEVLGPHDAWRGPPTISRGPRQPPLSFRRCTSTDGIHFTVWQGDKRVWHGTYSPGYDVEPDCTDEQTNQAAP